MAKKTIQRLLHDSDQNGMGIINIPDEIKRKGGKAWLTVNAQGKDDITPSSWHSEFSPEDWEDFKKNLNDNGRGITKVWIDDEEDVEDSIDTNDNGKIEKSEMENFTDSLNDYMSKNKKGRDDIPVTTRR
jgi:hypothetical protein